MNDQSFTYATKGRDRLMIYAPTDYDAPPTIELAGPAGVAVEFIRLSEPSLECGFMPTRIGSRGETIQVKGECGSYDCHRLVLGECKCGRHSAPVRFTAHA